MKKTKTFYIALASSLLVAISALVLGTIYDLQISKALADLSPNVYHSQNLFAIIFECVGENVLYVLLLCAFAILFFHFYKNPLKKNWLNISLLVALCLGSVLCSFYGLNKTLKYISLYTNFGLSGYVATTFGLATIFLVATLFAILIFYLFSRLKQETISKLTGFALAIIVVSALSNVIVQGSKYIFDRARYRAMVYEGYTNFEYYSQWFVINKSKFTATSLYAEEYFKSFPSGHACAAASIFLITLLPHYLEKFNTKNWKIALYFTAIIYTLAVAFSRVVGGAHFFTDVYIGAMVTVICVLIIKWLFVNKLRFLEQKHKKQN